MRSLFATLAHLFRPQASNFHRPWVLHPEAVAFYAIILIWLAAILPWYSSGPANFPAVLGFSSSITAEQVIEQTNQVRRSQGLEPLVYNAALTDAANRKGADMLSAQYWAHVSPSGKQPWAFMAEAGYRYKVAGENLARDFSNTGDMIQAWFNSPTHKANLLSNRYTEIGVAVVNGKLGDYETTVVVQMFGTPKGAAVAAAPETVQAPKNPAPTRVKIVAKPTEEPVVVLIEAPPVPTLIPANSELRAPQVSQSQGQVLAGVVLPRGQLNRVQPLLSPQLIIEVLAIAAVILLVSALICDWAWVHPSVKFSRVVGHNLAHVAYLLTIAGLIALYRSGTIF